MDFVPDLGDLSHIQKFNVGGMARAEIIDGCLVRVTFYELSASATDLAPACQLVWTVSAWRAARPLLEKVGEEIDRQCAGIRRRERQAEDGSSVH